MDLSRKRLDYCLLAPDGEQIEAGATPPDADGLRGFARGVETRHGPVLVRAAIESMNGARFVHDELERLGWEVEVADAQKVKGLGPLACKTDRIDAWVLAELSRRDLVPAVWLPGFEQRQERERARWRLFLVRKRSSLKHRIHAQLLAFGHTCPVSDLFGARGRKLLARLEFPEPWHSGVLAAVQMIDELDAEIAAIDKELKALGADHRYIPLLMSAPGIAWILGYTIAAEIGDITRFSSPKKLVGYTGLCPRVYQSGNTDRRGPLTHAGPKYLRWALMEAAVHACRHQVYAARYQANKKRLGKQRGAKVAQVDIARRLAEAIWHMLTRNTTFAPAGATRALAA
ncbi:IS110 family transposase [Paraconexibacter antarcticus]|uniref:IS110 family transposase n=3 Tax=Paraconexibacter antarcticus TaxID=2949664 RepID=A0ABY5DM56_9ACTN|nr:IS110 family transposase [Paraconexibacter antarcticus]UTI62762.1 IS110 family transposase [Paraconexibacter antarcticus]UTI63038.1 IS110 family transposase [Paraconexibacter antarcticus]UTI64311.1 IS110 family transposase [Paraconexibacter antarcticus]UTI65330.1 IS110 family transposase [Paraconexibacter antarcticus]